MKKHLPSLNQFCLWTTIWRPEQNWSRGIRIGTGTAGTDIVNNLIRGEIRLDCGKGTLRRNLAGRLEGFRVNPATGDLSLTATAARAINAGVPQPKVTHDIRGKPRDPQPDLNA